LSTIRPSQNLCRRDALHKALSTIALDDSLSAFIKIVVDDSPSQNLCRRLARRQIDVDDSSF
jgi:hypothetical protein